MTDSYSCAADEPRKSERARLDGYIGQLATTSIEKLSRDEQLAFWLNAYNAFVLQTVINNYPIHGRTATYPENSIRQIPGAFEQTKHRAAGRSVMSTWTGCPAPTSRDCLVVPKPLNSTVMV